MKSRENMIAIVLLSVIIFGSTTLSIKEDYVSRIFAQSNQAFKHPFPLLKDPNLKIQLVADGLLAPTGMLFLDKNDILVLQRYTSGFPLGGLTTVNLITNGSLKKEPVLTVPSGLCDNKNSNCDMFNERGLLGITARKINPDNATIAGNLEVFLYYTEITLNGEMLGNRVYKYVWDGYRLVKPTLILDLPALPAQNNNGGKIIVGPDDYLYVVIGDLTNSNRTIPIHEDPELLKDVLCCPSGHRGNLQNIIYGQTPDNTSVILRVNPNNGLPAPDNPFTKGDSTGALLNNNNTINQINAIKKTSKIKYDIDLLSRYFGYGIRNSFGITFDPVTGNLWDTENGEDHYDEINLVEPGFNSGWAKIMGPINRNNATDTDIRAYGLETWKGLKLSHNPAVTANDLVNFSGSKYSDPKFSWKDSIGVTAVGFLNSSKLGERYRNNLFVGDYTHGNLYFFKINKNRDGIDFGKDQPGLSDLVADNPSERSESVLGTGFDIITDIQTGPDGYLYIVSYNEYSNERPDNISRIYRIVPAS